MNGPGIARRRKPRHALKPRAVRKILRDAENLAEVAVDTVEQLDARNLGELARPLEDAVVRLAGRHAPEG